MTSLPQTTPPAAPRLRYVANPGYARRARGESMLWLSGGALVICLLMIAGLLGLVASRGGVTFWPLSLVQVQCLDGTVHLGEITRTEEFQPDPATLDNLPPAIRAEAERQLSLGHGTARRRLFRTENFELTGTHFHWVPDYLITREAQPLWAMVVERRAGGRFYGTPQAMFVDGQAVANDPERTWQRIQTELPPVLERFTRREDLREFGLGRLNDLEEEARLDIRRAELRHGPGSAAVREAEAAYEATRTALAAERTVLMKEIDELAAANARFGVEMETSDGTRTRLSLVDVVRMYPPNQLTVIDQVGVYLSRWWEFVSDLPREANSEGGVFPAIFGTVLLTLLMSLAVVPLGVLAALYLREYAKAGPLVTSIRIAINNLAGVPSIVFGVFGLGFFCYIVGGSIDSIFYEERLPNPTFGKGALIWASLTLALLTLPVVIVATEEALAAVPGSMREGSYACGASKWQTIRRIVMPRAMPGVMTGMILAMARGAGEVAPLMLVGAAKKADKLTVDMVPPYLHPSRSFLHLGSHIYDVGFQSQNSEAAKPLVFTTTLLLIGVITVLNVVAIWLRSRLRRKFVGAQF